MESSSPATEKTNQNAWLWKSLLSTLAWLPAFACILWTELKQSDLTETEKLVAVHICVQLETGEGTLWNEYACQRLIPAIVQCASSFSICFLFYRYILYYVYVHLRAHASWSGFWGSLWPFPLRSTNWLHRILFIAEVLLSFNRHFWEQQKLSKHCHQSGA